MYLLTGAGTIGLLLATTVAASAHPGALHIARATEWSWEPWIVASLAVAAGWYALGVLRLYRRFAETRLPRPAEIAAFAAGLATLVLALVSPIDKIAEQLFWVHMVQHLLLLLVASPLLVLGRPAIAFLWAFGRNGRKAVGHLWVAFGLHRGFTVLMHPLLVWLLFCGAFCFWHFPGPYQAALRDEGAHTLEHASFLVTALMFWSIVVEPSGRRRLGYGATLVFVMTAAILSGLPGALIALAPRPLYPVHADGAAAWGLTLLQDQQLAGIVMWIPGGFIYLAAAAMVFLKWLQAGTERRKAGWRQAAVMVALIALPLLLGGCDDSVTEAQAATGGDAKHGKALIRIYGCGSCHTVPGVGDATGLVGPPLDRMGRRVYIAGMLRNTPDNMVVWLRSPQSIVPGNAMPDMGLGERDARDLTAYLYTLR